MPRTEVNINLILEHDEGIGDDDLHSLTAEWIGQQIATNRTVAREDVFSGGTRSTVSVVELDWLSVG